MDAAPVVRAVMIGEALGDNSSHCKSMWLVAWSDKPWRDKPGLDNLGRNYYGAERAKPLQASPVARLPLT